MSFGSSDKVGLYLHRRRIDVAPETVRAFGGHVSLAREYPGLSADQDNASNTHASR
jgi:hypothetical protein